MVFSLAARNGIKLPSPVENPAYASPEALAESYENFTSLEDFLQAYYLAMSVLITTTDFEELGWEYFSNAHADGVRHAEVFFDPQSHTERGIDFNTAVEGYSRACRRAERELGMSTKLIMCFLRHLPQSSALATFKQASDSGAIGGTQGAGLITGVGLDSSEIGFPPELFTDVFALAEAAGLRRTAHGGEEGDTTYISGAINSLHAERIDHGIRIVEDPDLVEEVARKQILLTVCPLSNVYLRCVKSVSELPVRKFLDAGVRFSLNCDDPAYFGGYVLKSYCAVQEAFDLSVDDWVRISTNAIEGSWIGQERKAELKGMLGECVRNFVPSC